MEIAEMKRVIRFKEKPWMKNNIDRRIELGDKSTTDFGKVSP